MPTFTDGTVPTAANLNSIATGINNLGVLLTGVAATRQIIPVSTCSINATHSIPNAADTSVIFDVAAGVNEDHLWVASVGQPTVNTAGIYVIWAQVNFDYNAAGVRAAHITVNGTSIAANAVAGGSGNPANVIGNIGTAFLLVSPPLSLTAGTVLHLLVFQNSGAALNLIPNESGTSLSLIRIGAYRGWVPVTTPMPTFATGAIVHQAQLNLLSAGVNNLSLILAGVPATRTYVPAAAANINASQSIPNAADTTVTWNTTSINNDSMWSSGAADHLLIQTAGVYVALARTHFTSNATGTRAAHILLNGTNIIANSVAVTAVNAVGVSADTIFTAMTPPMRLSVGAALYLSVYQNSGAGLNLLTSLSGTMLAAIRIGA